MLHGLLTSRLILFTFQNFDRKPDVCFQFFNLQFKSELWIEQRHIKLEYAEEWPWQAVYQLKVGHFTNCVLPRYPSRVLLSLRFCLFWEDNSKVYINCHEKCLPAAAARVSSDFCVRQSEESKKWRKTQILVVPKYASFNRIEAGRNSKLQFIVSLFGRKLVLFKVGNFLDKVHKIS